MSLDKSTLHKEILEILVKIGDIVLLNNNNTKNYNYNTYFLDVYQKTESIFNNYSKILTTTKFYLENHQRSLDDIIQYLEESKIDFHTTRAYIRTMILQDTFYSQNNLYSNFMRGILGVLQGGLESSTLTNRGVLEIYHTHVINDMIDECKKIGKYENGKNKIELCELLIDSINEQQAELNIAWELVCTHYVNAK